MGRRSINTTKSGKYMNPTDQARKEARKQELKKNKKQRQMVRAAVLKGKDPMQIIEEMEKIDQMEYNVNQPSPLNEKVLKDKRKKLKDTLDRVLVMHYKDDPDKWAELKRKQSDYEHKRNQMVIFFESVRSAQQVQIDDIPLPQQLPATVNLPTIPLPHEQNQPSTTSVGAPLQQQQQQQQRKQEHTIYSIATALKLQALGQPVKEPPGCPVGPPPDLDDEGNCIPFGKRSAKSTEENVEKTIENTELNKKNNVDEFMKEIEFAQKKRKENTSEKELSPPAPSVSIPPPPGTLTTPPAAAAAVTSSSQTSQPPPKQMKLSNLVAPPVQPPPPQQKPPSSLMFPGLHPQPHGGTRPQHPQTTAASLAALRIPPPRLLRMPPPPSTAAGLMHHHHPPHGHPHSHPHPHQLSGVTPNVLSAAPQLIGKMVEPMIGGSLNPMSGLVGVGGGVVDSSGTVQKQGATISAKPQIRNLSADVTRFVPSTLRVKREEKKSKVNTRALVHELRQKEFNNLHSGGGAQKSGKQEQHAKDDAYKLFMKEMENLL